MQPRIRDAGAALSILALAVPAFAGGNHEGDALNQAPPSITTPTGEHGAPRACAADAASPSASTTPPGATAPPPGPTPADHASADCGPHGIDSE